jgi:phosphoheptose isomerase
LLAISTSGNSANVIKAATAAERAGMKTVALTGYDGGLLGKHANLSVHLNIAHHSTPRVQEMHITLLHIICSLVDEMMFGDSS